jgi:hypothetical protein
MVVGYAIGAAHFPASAPEEDSIFGIDPSLADWETLIIPSTVSGIVPDDPPQMPGDPHQLPYEWQQPVPTSLNPAVANGGHG